VGDKERFWIEIDEILAQTTHFYIEFGAFFKKCPSLTDPVK
jgi:hypothetical protein